MSPAREDDQFGLLEVWGSGSVRAQSRKWKPLHGAKTLIRKNNLGRLLWKWQSQTFWGRVSLASQQQREQVPQGEPRMIFWWQGRLLATSWVSSAGFITSVPLFGVTMCLRPHSGLELRQERFLVQNLILQSQLYIHITLSIGAAHRVETSCQFCAK